MHKIKFSIVIPAFNEEETIEKAVKSLLHLNYNRKDFEIIVVDNASTDKTFEKAKSAGADKVVVELTVGTNMARERGRREASGDIIAFLGLRIPLHGTACLLTYLTQASIRLP